MAKLKLKIKKDVFGDLLQKLSDLTNIEDIIKIKINRETIFIYSIVVSGDINSIIAFKNYTLKSEDYIDNIENLEHTYDFVIKGAKKFVKSLGFIESTNDKIVMEAEYREMKDSTDMLMQHVRFSSGKLKINTTGDEPGSIRNIEREKFEKFLDPENAKWNFKVSKSDFSDIKKLCSINTDSLQIQLESRSGKIYFSELNKWELEVDEIEKSNTNLTYDKKYLHNITEGEDFINFSIYSTFILIRGKNSNLMISYEQDFNPDSE